MNNTLGNALQKAYLSKFVWKGEKRKEGNKYVQDSKLMIDMTEEELQDCYNQCHLMLYNEDPKNLGRYYVLEEIEEQINKCNVELLLRYYEKNSIPRTTLNLNLRKMKANTPEIEDWSTVAISNVTDGLPPEFRNISIEDVFDGCIYCLEAFDKSHLTMNFITKMGLWFTKAEETELKGETNSNVERVRVAKERLHLPQKLFLRFSEKGLSYHEMRAILMLPKKQRYDAMTTEQLTVLRDKILPRLQRQIDWHISGWKNLMKQIKMVAEEKGFTINDPN